VQIDDRISPDFEQRVKYETTPMCQRPSCQGHILFGLPISGDKVYSIEGEYPGICAFHLN